MSIILYLKYKYSYISCNTIDQEYFKKNMKKQDIQSIKKYYQTLIDSDKPFNIYKIDQ